VIFVDSNVPMYVSVRDHPHRDPSRRFLERARAGAIEICTSTEVLQEILYRYTALNRRDLAASVYELFVQFCPSIYAVSLADTDRAKGLVAAGGVGVRDAVHAAVMLNHDVAEIATFHEGFHRIAGIRRVRLS